MCKLNLIKVDIKLQTKNADVFTPRTPPHVKGHKDGGSGAEPQAGHHQEFE